MSTKKLISTAAFAAALAAGGVAGAALGAPGISGAQESEDGSTADTPSETSEPTEPGACAGAIRGPHLAAAAGALGMTEEELREARVDGQSLADVAAEQGIEVQTLIDALVADATARTDEAVAAGELDAAEAEERLAELTERITALVNGEAPAGGPGFGGPGVRDPGFGPPGADGAPEAESDTDA